MEKREIKYCEPNLSKFRKVKKNNKNRLEKYKNKKVLCLFCGLITSFGRIFSAHLNRKYRELFKSKFFYSTYLKLGREIYIFYRYNWIRYLSENYSGDNGALFVEIGKNKNLTATKREIKTLSILDIFIDPILKFNSV